jgi:hypothetical protein
MPVGVIRGVVYDSIVSDLLVGAEVWLEGSVRSAITDAVGAFRIDRVAAAPRAITFAHAALDSLGFGAPVGRVAGTAVFPGPNGPQVRDGHFPSGLVLIWTKASR